jgi:Ca-activated chloride channel family protein
MKPARVAALAALGMLLTGGSVYSLTPAGGFGIAAEAATVASSLPSVETAQVDAPAALGEMSAGTTLRVEGRLAFKTLARGGSGDTHLLLEVGADSTAAAARAPVNLAIVVDRSGSMKGTRLRNALQGALTAVERLNDGDVVSVVAFDSRPSVVVPPTPIDSSTRGRIRSDIQGITLGGDTCISCGIDEAMGLLDRTTGRVNRMIVLSDGEATAGVRDLPGFRSIAQRASARGTSITTIGVDVDYNERILSTIAQDSNGRHYFVANDAGLEKVFDSEAQSLTTAVASGAEASVELPPGVELVRVVDRTFRRAGNRVIFPLGTITAGEKKSVLLQVRVPTDREGQLTVANVDVTFRDPATGADQRCGGKLLAAISAAGASDVDSVVETRVNRTATADALKEATELFKQGRVEEARQKLAEREKGLANVAAAAPAKAPKTKAEDVKKDLEAQVAFVQRAEQAFATPPADKPSPAGGAANPAPSRIGKEGVKQSAEDEFTMRR